jgi:hypothetical protein
MLGPLVTIVFPHCMDAYRSEDSDHEKRGVPMGEHEHRKD